MPQHFARPPVLRSVALAAFSAIAFLVACDSSTSTPDPALIALVQAPSGTPLIGSQMLPPPFIEIRASDGDALGGVAFTARVTAGGGSLSGTPARTVAGPTSIGIWTLGPSAGTNTVRVESPGLTPLDISVVSTVPSQPGSVATISVVAGKFQMAAASTTLPVNPVFAALKSTGEPVPNVTMTFTVILGGGTIGTTTATTDAQGRASPGPWQLGSPIGTQLLAAAVGAVNTTLYATATGLASGTYDIDLRFVGTPPAQQVQDAFAAAVQRIRMIVVGDLTPVSINQQHLAQCNVTATTPGSVDDLLIYAEIKPIDGVNGILAQSGPCQARASSGLPVVGTMTFDEADVNKMVGNGTLQAVVLHEMMHVLGFGTIWGPPNGSIQLLLNQGTSNPIYLGAAAGNQYKQLGGNSDIGLPVEGLPEPEGTRDAHWRNSLFGVELMTGFIDLGANPLSVLTIGALADLGYRVSFGAADPYTQPSAAVRAAGLAREGMPLREVLLKPRYYVDDRAGS